MSYVKPNVRPTGRTKGASSGFDLVGGIPFPEDRSVRRFDGDDLIGKSGAGTIHGINVVANPADYQQSFTPGLFSGVSSNNITGGGSSGGFDTTFDPTVGTPAVAAAHSAAQEAAAQEYVDALANYKWRGATSEHKKALDEAKQALIDLDVSREQIASVTNYDFPNGIDVSGGIQGVMGPTLKDAAGQVLQGVAEAGDWVGEAFGHLIGIGDHDQYGPTLPVPGVGWQWGATGKQTPIQIGTAKDGTPIVIYMPGGGFLGGAAGAAQQGGGLFDILKGGWQGMGGAGGILTSPSVIAAATAMAADKDPKQTGSVILNPGGIDKTGGTTVLTDGSGNVITDGSGNVITDGSGNVITDGGGLVDLDVSGKGGAQKITTGSGSFVDSASSGGIENLIKSGSAATDSFGGIDYSGSGAIQTSGKNIGGFNLEGGGANAIKTAGVDFTSLAPDAQTAVQKIRAGVGFDKLSVGEQQALVDLNVEGVGNVQKVKYDVPGALTPAEEVQKAVLLNEVSPLSSSSAPLKTSSPPQEVGGGGGGGGGGGMAGGSGLAQISGDPGDLVDIEYLFDVGGDSIFAPLSEEEEDELLYAYSRGGAVKRFSNGGQALPGSDEDIDNVIGSTNKKKGASGNWFKDNAATLLGGGIGAILGLSDDKKSPPSGYLGGIPEYTYDRTLKQNAFSPTMTNTVGQQVARRPGSGGRSYFDYPTTAAGVVNPYTPVMETLKDDEGEEYSVQRTLGGAQRRADAAAAATAAQEQKDLLDTIGQDYIDVMTANAATDAATIIGDTTTAGTDTAGTDTTDTTDTTVITDTAGTDTAGTDTTVITDTAGTDTAGTDTAGTDTAGTDTAGTDTAGTDTAGTDTAGTDTAGTDTAGTDTTLTDFQIFENYINNFRTGNPFTAADYLTLGGQTDYTPAQLAGGFGFTGDTATAFANNLAYYNNLANILGSRDASAVEAFQSYMAPFGGRNLTTEDLLVFNNQTDYTIDQLAQGFGFDTTEFQTAIDNAVALEDAFNTTSTLTSDDDDDDDDTATSVITSGTSALGDFNSFLDNYRNRDLTAGDYLSFGNQDAYSLAAIASGLQIDENDLVSNINYYNNLADILDTSDTGTISDFEEYLTGLQTSGGTTQDYLGMGSSGFTLAQIAGALGLTESELADRVSLARSLTATTTIGGDASTLGSATDTTMAVDPNSAAGMFNSFLDRYRDQDLTTGDYINLGDQTEYSLAQIASGLGIDESELTSNVNYYSNLNDVLGDTASIGEITDFGDYIEGLLADDDLSEEELLGMGDSGYTIDQIATMVGKDPAEIQNNIDHYTTLNNALAATTDTTTDTTTTDTTDTTTQVSNRFILTQEDINALVGEINAGTLTVAEVAEKYGLSEDEVQAEVDTINLGNIQAIDQAGIEYLLSEINAGNLTVAEVATQYGLTEKEVQDAVDALNAQAVGDDVVVDDVVIDTSDVTGTDFTDFDIFGSGGTGEGSVTTFESGGMTSNQGYYLGGTTDGMADQVPATIGGEEPARLSDGEFVIPADVVSHLGNGNSDAGATQLYSMMDRVRQQRTGTTEQGVEINPMQQLPA